MKLLSPILLTLILSLPIPSISQPDRCVVKHDIGTMILGRGERPEIGNSNYFSSPSKDCFTGDDSPPGSCLYPKNTLITYLGYGFAWVGGILRGDTLVSSPAMWRYDQLYTSYDPFEFHSHNYPLRQIEHRSVKDSSSDGLNNAVSEQDFVSVTTDTLTYGFNIVPDYLSHLPHKPLGIEFINKSYAWSIGYAEDIVFFDWTVRNISDDNIRSGCVGIQLNATIGDLYVADPMQEVAVRNYDELGGFLQYVQSSDGCNFTDTVSIVWNADNDGDPVAGNFVYTPTLDASTNEIVASCRHVSGIELISAPIDIIPGNTVSYNWWDGSVIPVYNFGPRQRANLRDFRTGGLGTPWGDANKYYVMLNREIDYDPAYTAKITPFNLTWMYPDQIAANDIASGSVLSQLLSVGSFDIPPGGEVSIVFAFIIGENFHTKPFNATNLPNNPDEYYSNLDFSDLLKNAEVARYVYDNPGVDTDGDGYAGEFRICVLDSFLNQDSVWIPALAETTYYKGDGVPDWRPALPPPAPKIWVTPMFRGIHIRFNGYSSENSKDIFTRLNDFEGYAVYIARDDRETSYSRLATYDIENYDKYIWNYEKQPEPGWELLDFPSTMQEIRCNYAQSCNDTLFDPLSYRSSRPYQHPVYPESLFYWEKHESNVDEFGVTTDIKKVYPNARDPRLIPADSLTPDDFTDDGYFKFFEYEYTIEDILPTVPYYVSVTAFDFGWPKSNLEPLESSITENAQEVFASLVDSAFNGTYKKVVVYPNPYRNDQNYRSRGYEGLGQEDRITQRVRRIHFANLPPKCIISIFSLDGDLVREIHHDKDPNDPASSHTEWGLISRNGLAVVSGLYYWVVEFPNGETQMGKLAIIL